jgi:hypothetical protein
MAESQGERQWIVEPPGPGEVSLHMAFGDDVQLTPEQEEALGELLRTLEAGDAEVSGHANAKPCPTNCTKLECGNVVCTGLGCGTLEIKVAGIGMTLMGTFGSGTP